MRISSNQLREETRISYLFKTGLPISCIGAIIAFTAVLYSHLTATKGTGEVIDVQCTPSGSIVVLTEGHPNYDPYWDPSMFLSITLGFGEFSYATAKGIDIGWDAVVGRGGQILLAILAYPVLRRSLTNYMERHEVHFKVFASMAFDKISLSTLAATARDLFTRSKFGDRLHIPVLFAINWRFVSHIVVLMYILGFPTMVAIMTGYQAKFAPLVPRPDNQLLMKVSSLRIPDFVIIDGDRVGLQANQLVYSGDPMTEALVAYAGTTYAQEVVGLVPSVHGGFPMYCYHPRKFGYGSGEISTPWYDMEGEGCMFDVREGMRPPLPGQPPSVITIEGSHYGHYTSSNITLNGHKWILEEPPLDIIAQVYTEKIGVSTINFMATKDLAFNSTYLRENGSCQPSEYYVWGFSSLLLLVFCLLTIIFASILTALHADAFWNSRADRFSHDVNHYRDAVDLVYELKDQIFGEAIQDMPARELEAEVEDRSKYVSLDSCDAVPSRREGCGPVGEKVRSKVKLKVPVGVQVFYRNYLATIDADEQRPSQKDRESAGTEYGVPTQDAV